MTKKIKLESKKVGPKSNIIEKEKDIDLSTKREQAEIKQIEENTKQITQNIQDRKTSTVWVKMVISLWLLGTFVLFVLYGLKCIAYPPEVICALLATTTANVIGLGIILLKGLFPKITTNINWAKTTA